MRQHNDETILPSRAGAVAGAQEIDRTCGAVIELEVENEHSHETAFSKQGITDSTTSVRYAGQARLDR